MVARSLDALAGGTGRVVGYVENMAGYWCGDCAAVRPLFPAAEPLPLPLLASIPFDPALATACDRGDASVDSPAVAALRDGARRLYDLLEAS